jgi:hypothetical protein
MLVAADPGMLVERHASRHACSCKSRLDNSHLNNFNIIKSLKYKEST